VTKKITGLPISNVGIAAMCGMIRPGKIVNGCYHWKLGESVSDKC
jgi:hypothetical protein